MKPFSHVLSDYISHSVGWLVGWSVGQLISRSRIYFLFFFFAVLMGKGSLRHVKAFLSH